VSLEVLPNFSDFFFKKKKNNFLPFALCCCVSRERTVLSKLRLLNALQGSSSSLVPLQGASECQQQFSCRGDIQTAVSIAAYGIECECRSLPVVSGDCPVGAVLKH
jgi:hypothetical protein